MNPRLSVLTLVLLALTAASLPAQAQQDATLLPPHARAGEDGKARLYTYHTPREAVVVASFTVKADGSTADVALQGGFYDEEIAASVLREISNTRFEPATLAGQAIDFYGYTSTYRISHKLGTAISPRFRKDYEAVQALYQRGDYAGAEALINDLIANKIQGLFEFAFLNKTLIPIYLKRDRPHDALRASRLATLTDVPQESSTPFGSLIRQKASSWPYILPRDSLLAALRERFAIASSLGNLSEALQVADELHRITPLATTDPIAVEVKDLKERFVQAPQLVSQQRIGPTNALHLLSRRSFSVANLKNGGLKRIDVICSSERRSLDYKDAAEWTVPSSWGPCALQFHGSEGAVFSLVELNAATASNAMGTAKPYVATPVPPPAQPEGTARRGAAARPQEAEEALRFLKRH